MADHIGGANTDGQIFSNQVFNANNAGRNTTMFFQDRTDALDLGRVIVITTGLTASASELVINSLVPYLDVVLIGDTTFGKPVGSFGFDFCDKTLNPISFTTRNANDEGDYFDGLAVNCPAADGLDSPLGDPQETLLVEALAYLQNGVCTVKAGKPPKRAKSKPAAQTGLRAEHNVF